MARTGSFGDGNVPSRVDNKKADGKHPENPQREDGKWMRTEGNKRKTVEEEKESVLRKTVKNLLTWERAEEKTDSEEKKVVVDLAEVEVNEEEVEWRTVGETQCAQEDGDLDPEQVRQGREEEMSTKGQDAGDVRVWFVERSDVESGQGSDHDEKDRLMKNDVREFVRC